MRASALAIALLAAACRPGGEGDRVVDANQIERLSTPGEEPPDPLAPVRLEPIPAELAEAEGPAGPGCRFTRTGTLLLVAGEAGAIVRIGGETRHLVPSAPVGPSGGFFEDRQLSISIGRTGGPGPEAGGMPGRIAVTERRIGVQRELRGLWTCD